MTLAAAGLSASAPAQLEKPVRIGLVASPEASSPVEEGFRQGLRELGYVEGENAVIETLRPPDAYSELTRTAADLKQAGVQVIVAFSTPAAKAMLAETPVPVVFLTGGDPVATGLAASLARPGGRATGVTLQLSELTAKRIELLHQLAPKARRIGVLVNTTNPVGRAQLEEAQTAAGSLGLRVLPFDVRTPADLEEALRRLTRNTADAVLVTGDLFLFGNKAKIATSLRVARLPAIYPNPLFHQHGALMSYGPDVKAAANRLAGYVDRILKGASPGDLPIEQVSKQVLVIDLRIARELRLQVPQQLQLRADELIR